MSPQLRRFVLGAALTPAVIIGSLYLQPAWVAAVGCILALFLGLPISIVLYIDYARAKAASSSSATLAVRTLATPIVLLGFVSIILGLAMIGWVLFNVFVERQPSYTGGGWLSSFGIGPLLVIFGWRQLRRPLSD